MICMMCVRPVNYGIAFSCNYSPKLLTRVIPVFSYTEKIDFQGNVDIFAITTKCCHLLFIDFCRTRVPDYIRMGKIKEFSCF